MCQVTEQPNFLGTTTGREEEDLLQNDFKILADLSHSGPRFVGQNASEPILFVILLTGAPSFSKRVQPLSKAALPPCLVLSQVDIVVCFSECG